MCAPASEHRVKEIFAGKIATQRHLRAFTTGCGARSPGRPCCQHTVDRAATDSRHARRCLCQRSSAAAGSNCWLRHRTAAAATRTPTSLRASTPCRPAGCDTINRASRVRTCESLGQHWAAAQVGNDARNFSHESNMARKCECMRAYFWPPPATEREVARDLEVEPTPQLELGNKRD